MVIQVTTRLFADQYDGTNGAAIVAAMEDAFIVSDNGSVLVIEITGTIQHTINVDEWVVYADNGGTNVLIVCPTPHFEALYSEFVEPGGIDSVTFTQAAGSSSVAASVLGQTVNHDVNLSESMPSTDYVPIVQLRGAPNVLAGHAILNVTVLDVDTVRVQVQSAALSLAGATVHVTAFSVLVS